MAAIQVLPVQETYFTVHREKSVTSVKLDVPLNIIAINGMLISSKNGTFVRCKVITKNIDITNHKTENLISSQKLSKKTTFCENFKQR